MRGGPASCSGEGLGGQGTGTDRAGSHGARRSRAARTGPWRDPGGSHGMRRVSHRPPPGRRGSPAEGVRGDARSRGRRAGRRGRSRRGPLRHRRPGRDRLAASDVRPLPVLPARSGEPLPATVVHRMGRPRRLRPAGGDRRGVRVPAPRGVRRRAGGSAAPCAGIVGHRGRSARVPPGGRLGLYGFGVRPTWPPKWRSPPASRFTSSHVRPRRNGWPSSSGAASAGGAAGPPPAPLDGAVLYAPAGDLVPVALQALDRGGRLSIAGIHLSDVPTLRYEDHLFQEREVVSVTASTRLPTARSSSPSLPASASR